MTQLLKLEGTALIRCGGINLTGIVTATEAIVGTAVTINSGGIDTAAGIVTAYSLDAAINW